MDFSTSPENAADVQAIVALLTETPVDGVLTYEAASTAIGRDVTGRARHILNTAKKAAEQQTGSLFEVVRTVGLRRMPASAAVSVGTQVVSKIRRTARRGMARMGLVRGNMTNEEQTRVAAFRSQLGAIALAADAGAPKKIEAAMTDTALVPAGRVLELLK